MCLATPLAAPLLFIPFETGKREVLQLPSTSLVNMIAYKMFKICLEMPGIKRKKCKRAQNMLSGMGLSQIEMSLDPLGYRNEKAGLDGKEAFNADLLKEAAANSHTSTL